ncbi:hypothetical protein HK097_010730, partial [Rhizophlyctis rosea]
LPSLNFAPQPHTQNPQQLQQPNIQKKKDPLHLPTLPSHQQQQQQSTTQPTNTKENIPSLPALKGAPAHQNREWGGKAR